MNKKYKSPRLLIRVMKISMQQLFLSFIFCTFAYANTALSQNELKETVTIQAENTQIKRVLTLIEKQVDYRFIYSSSAININKKVSLNVTNKKLEEVLNDLFKLIDIQYSVKDRRILLRNNTLANATVSLNNNIILEKPIKGNVKDENGQALPGVTIQIQGTNQGTQTDANGNFAFSSLDDKEVLVISFVGYVSQKIQIGNKSLIEVSLIPDNKSLDEVIVVGYGTQKKSDLTGAVGTIKTDAIQERRSASLNQAIAGRVTGVNVSVNSGRPGGRANIRIRGNTSVSVANNPLYVIDGVILVASDLANGSTPIDYLNANDVSSIEILKDASATAIYGARGANGVILISTKRGSQDGGRISYDTDFSVGVLPRKIPLLNSAEFLLVEDQAYVNAKKYDPVGFAGGKYTNPATKRNNPLLFDSSGKPLYDTDWQDESLKPALTQNHQLGFSGGNSKDSYGLYLGYRDEDGLMNGSYLTRYSSRFVLDSQIKPWLKVGGSLSYNVQNESQVDPLGGGGIVAMRQVLEALPIIPKKYPDGRWGSNEDYPGMEGGGNPIQVSEERLFLLKTQSLMGNFYTNINLAKGLDLRTTVGVNVINQETNYYGGRTLNYISRNQGGDAALTSDRHNSWQIENYLTYTKKISEDHSFVAMLGQALQHVDRMNFTARAQRFQDDYFQFNNLGTGAVTPASSSSLSAYGLESYFGRFNYNLKDKYLLTFTGRVDGSSKFGSENRYAVFPSAALAWKVIEEDFMQDVPFVSNLKLRTSYGITGNSEITAYQSLAGLGNYAVIFNNTRQVGIGVNRLANTDLRWEKTAQVDVGLELGLINNKINIEVDLYRKLTSDMLLSAPVPSSSGFTTVSKNVGSMENRGLEIGINSVNITTPNFSWNTNFNISFNQNKVVELAGGSDIFLGATIVRVGAPVGSFFGYVNQGTYTIAEEGLATKYRKKPGDIKNQDTNNDGVINDNDRVIIGKGIPDSFGSFINTFTVKNFELMVDLQFMSGNDVLWRSKHSAEDRVGIANSFKTVLNGWTPANQTAKLAELRPVSAGYNTFNDTDKIIDGSFIRGRNAVFSYKFSPDVVRKMKLSKLRAFVSVQNFFLATKFPGYDPEVANTGAAFDQGFDLYQYPKARTFMIGLNIGL